VDGPTPLLLVAHASPPLGGPAVLRVASWMRHWPSLGLDPMLVTAPPEDAAAFHGYPVVPGSDDALEGRTVLRVATGRPRGVAGLLRAVHAPSRIAWTFTHRAVREPEAPWARSATAAAIALGRERGARAVVSTSQPFVAHEVGRAVAEELGVPWIADFRDPMTEAPGRAWPSRLHRALERREERRLFEAAALVWANTESAAARWRERFPFAHDRVRVRRNGVEARSIPAGTSPPPVPPLRIGHVGRFTERAPSGRLAFLDHRPEGPPRGRSPLPLFRALARVRAEEPSSRGNVVWVTVGDPGPEPPAGVLHEHHPALPNERALAVAATCHALYLPLTAPGPSGALYVPQKAYEYAALGRPVLVSGTPRETTQLLGALARVAAPGDDLALARHVRALWVGEASEVSRPVRVPTREEIAAACAKDVLGLLARGPRASE
jgi:hypothetical protein